MKCLTTVKNDLRSGEIQGRKTQLQALQYHQWGSPHAGALIEAEISKLEVQLAKFSSLTVAPTAHFPRGMIARIALRLLGGPAANHASTVMYVQVPRMHADFELGGPQVGAHPVGIGGSLKEHSGTK